MVGESIGEVPFQAHVELLQWFLAHREEIVERIQGLLNAQRKPVHYLQDGPLLARHFEDCFFARTAITHNQSVLQGQLKEAHWAGGFKPSVLPGLHNDLVDPGEMMVRAFHMWRQIRWPGRNGRARYAHTLFNLYLIRALELLCMRLWDPGSGNAGDGLVQIQGLLDQLWKSSLPDQPIFVRDARWLLPLAQSPTTDELGAYFRVAERIAATLSDRDQIEILTASVQMAGGHLRSQLRHYGTRKGVSLEENSLVLSSRNSNALDFALLIQGLVPLLKAYEQACGNGDGDLRRALAGAVCQGISADPDLFVNRTDLLGAYSMIEHLFIATDHEERVAYTSMGLRHVQLLQDYAGLIDRLAKPLHEDCPLFKPVDGAYSPYGLIYGFSSNLIEHMALKSLQPDAMTQFSLEDVFSDGDANSGKLAWISGWRQLPHIDPDVQRLFEYPREFAEDIFDRVEQALRRRVSVGAGVAIAQTGRLFILPADDPEAGAKAALIPELPVQYIQSSDAQIVAARKAQSYDQRRLLHDRQEGMFAVSYETPGGWVAISKDFLTEILAAGRDVKIVGLPGLAADVLRLMCRELTDFNRG